MSYFEELTIGDRVELGAHTFEAAEIKEFAREFDPQPFHLDEASAAKSQFGALCASGWHTASMWMHFFAIHVVKEEEGRRAAGKPAAPFGPSPGIRELRWLRPVFPGDTISFTTEVADLRPSASRPDWGLLTARNGGTNQHGQPVISFFSTVFIPRRPASAS